jgi:hypothetical protein
VAYSWGNWVRKKPNSNPSTPPFSTQLIHNFRLYLRRTQHLFLYVNDPERIEFSDVMRAIERLKKIVAKHVTGNCNVVIEILPRDWVFVYPPDEPDEAEQAQVAGVNESEPNDAPKPAADEDTDADAP